MEAHYLRACLGNPIHRNVGSGRLFPHSNVRWILVWERLSRLLMLLAMSSTLSIEFPGASSSMEARYLRANNGNPIGWNDPS